jgi:Tol biopolymer transport system component
MFGADKQVNRPSARTVVPGTRPHLQHSKRVIDFGDTGASTVPGNSPSRTIRFSAFEVDLQTGELRKRGQKLRLQEQPFQVLAALLERPGEVVTREELRSRLWPADSFVDFDHGLNAAIKRLRDALGESAETPIFVETLARRGYRFIGNVAISAATEPAPLLWRWPFTTRNAAIAGVIVSACALPFLFYRHAIRPKAVQLTVIPVVTDIGEKYAPALSPNGQHLAYVWNGGAGPHFNLYVKVVGTEESLRLTKQPSLDFSPTWSPDRRYIAFRRILKGATGIYIIPALGGAERRVLGAAWDEDAFWFGGHLSWSPDGKLLAYSDFPSRGDAPAISLLSVDSLEIRKFTSPTHSKGDFDPEFSPDGQTLAFTRDSPGGQSIFVIPVSGGEERRLTTGTQKRGLAWTPDGREIVFADEDAGSLLKVPLRGGHPERLQFGEDVMQPSIRGNRMAFVQIKRSNSIWRRKLNSLPSAGPPERFISSTRRESGAQFSPDGSRIAFESTRSGAYEVWLCQSDGTNLMQLTHLNPSVTGTPRWSPNGQRIAFDSHQGTKGDVFVVDSQGGPPTQPVFGL